MAYTLKRPRKGRRFWTVIIRLPGVAATERGTKCERRSDARAIAERLHSQLANAQSVVPLIMALEALLGLRTRQKRSPATLSIIEEKGAQLCRFFGLDRDVRSLRLADTTAYVAKRRADGVSDSTIAKEMGVLRAALRYLVKLDQYDRLPDALWPPELSHASGTRTRWLTWDEYLKVLHALPADRRDAFLVYCHCGLTYSELYRLQASDVGELLHVPGTKTKYRDRHVPMTPDALEVLTRRAQAAPVGAALWPPTHANENTQRSRWLKVLGEACERAGVEHVSTNDLRRSFCSWAFQQGVAEPLVIKWMGHNSSKMVRSVYAQPAVEQHQAEVAKMPSRKRG